MEKFIGRSEDLSALEEIYKAPFFRAVALIGRRRIGKTCLVKEFIKDKDGFYVQFLNSTVRDNLDRLESKMKNKFDRDFSFSDSMDFFDELERCVKGKRMVIVFDEYPFMSAKDAAFSSLLQNFIDNEIGKSIVIITGSSIGMMDQEILDHSRPLFGRVHRYCLGPMGISDCAQFHPRMSDEDKMRMYLTFGGIPMYYDSPPSRSYKEYLEKNVLRVNSPLNIEGEGAIRREFRQSDECIVILDSIAENRNSVPEIQEVTGLDRSTVRHHIDAMKDMGIVESIHLMAGAKSKSERFRIRDRFLAFYYQVMRKNQSDETSAGYDYEAMKGKISTFLGRMFERECSDYVMRRYSVREIGTWHGKVPAGRKDAEDADIDIVAYVDEGGNAVEYYAECKFTGQPVGFADMNDLAERMKSAHVGINNRMMFFSRSGFDRKFEEYAKENRITLVGLKDMLSA